MLLGGSTLGKAAGGAAASAAVPEPATLVLIASGMLSVFCFRRVRES